MFQILFKVNGAWQVLIGHGCSTIEAAEAYIQMSPKSFHLLKNGEDWPAPPEPEIDPRAERIKALSPETKAAILRILGDI